MQFGHLHFGSIEIDSAVYEWDIVIDHGKVLDRIKNHDDELGSVFGHSPLQTSENIPWDCKTLYVGTGVYGNMPVRHDFEKEADSRSIKLVIDTTPEIIRMLSKTFPGDANVVLHLTC